MSSYFLLLFLNCFLFEPNDELEIVKILLIALYSY